MISDRKILAAAIKSREVWTVVQSHVTSADIGSDTSQLLRLIQEYYERDESAQTVDIPVLSSSLSRHFQNPKQVEALRTVLTTLPDVSAMNIAAEILALKRHNKGLELAAALQRSDYSKEGLNGSKKLLSEFQILLDQSTLETTESNEEIIEKFQVLDLVEKSFDPKTLIPLLPNSLNNVLGGGCKPGHHVLVFGPVEMGKSLLVINMLAGWVEHKLRVLYVGNEDPVEDLMMRFICRLTQRTRAEVMAHPAKAQLLLEKKGYEAVTFAPLAPGNFETIQRLVNRCQPRVLVLDQLRNIDVDLDHRTQALEKAATEARNLAKRNNLLVVSVSQAADSASGKRILNRGDVDSSNIGIPGQCDVMLGIGATEEDEQSNRRFLSLPKNKVSGSHETWQIEIAPQLSMVIE